MALSTPRYNLRVFVEPDGAYLLPCAMTHGFRSTPKCRYPGVYAEDFDLIRGDITKSMNITPVFAPENTTKPWEYFQEMMQNGSIDTAVTCFTRTAVREKMLKFNRVLMHSTPRFALAAKHEITTSPLDGFMKFVSVFQPSLWLAILLLSIIVYLYRHYGPKIATFSNLEWQKKLLLISVTLLSMFSLGLYAKVLLSRLVAPHHHPLFEDTATLAEAVRLGEAKLVMYPREELSDRMEKAAERAKLDKTTDPSPIAQLQQALSMHTNSTLDILPFMNPDFPAEKIQTLLDNNHVFVAPYDTILMLAQRVCNWRVVKLEDLGIGQCWWMFGNHTPDWVVEKMDAALLKQFDSLEPITIRYTRRSEYSAKMATRGCPTKTKARFVFSYSEFLGASVILMLGFGAANIGLVGELTATAMKKLWVRERNG